MALEGIRKAFQVFLVRICLLGCLLRYLVKCLVFQGTISPCICLCSTPEGWVYSTTRDVKYTRGIMSTVGDIMSTPGDIMINVGEGN